MRKWKRAAAIALTAAMGMSTFAGCGQKEETKEEAKTEANAEETEENTSSEDAKDTETSSAKEYNGQDVSDKVELVMYVIGDEAEDEQKVLGKINEKLEEKINATLTVKHMSLSDYAQKYSLTIASGEAIDIIYASSLLRFPMRFWKNICLLRRKTSRRLHLSRHRLAERHILFLQIMLQ